MTTLRQIDPIHAKRLIISKQHLDAQARPPMLELIQDLGCLQLDPIRKVERTHLLVLWSRLGHYDIDELEIMHYKANVLLFIVQDPLESDLSKAGGLSVTQGQEQITINSNDENQARFNQLYQEKLQRLTQAMADSPLPIGLVNTVDPVDQQLAKLLQGH